MDLAQAEAVADLIESTTEQAARSAMRSLQGVFSERINTLLTQLTELRMYVEAAMTLVMKKLIFLQKLLSISNYKICLLRLMLLARAHNKDVYYVMV